MRPALYRSMLAGRRLLVVLEHRVGFGQPEHGARRALNESRRRGYRPLEGQACAVLAEINHDDGEYREQARRIAQETRWVLPRGTLPVPA